MNKTWLFLIIALTCTVYTLEECTCEQLSLLDCYQNRESCIIDNDKCRKRTCSDFYIEDDCGGISNLQSNGEYQYCYWNGEKCKEYSIDDRCNRTYVSEIYAQLDCTYSCKVASDGKSCTKKENCLELGELACGRILNDKYCWYNGSSCQEATQCSEIQGDQCDEFWGSCMMDDAQQTCVDYVQEESENVICESFLNEDSCLYKYPTGKEDKMCLYLEGKCKEINKDFPCSILDRTNCEDRFNYVCYYDRETFKCRDYACKERDCQSTKAASYPKKDGENYLCKFDPEKQECGDADIQDLIDDCNRETNNYYTWINNECKQCYQPPEEEDDDDSAQLFSTALLLSIFLAY